MTNKPPPELPLADMGPLNPKAEPVKLDELKVDVDRHFMESDDE